MKFVFESHPHNFTVTHPDIIKAPDYQRYALDKYREYGDFVFFGSLGTAERLKHIGLGHIELDRRFDFSRYAKLLHSTLLINSDWKKGLEKAREVKNEEGLFFGRPDSYAKDFDGQLFHSAIKSKFKETGKHWIVSSPKVIVEEYRCFIVNNELVTASKYRTLGQMDIENITEEDHIYAKLEALCKKVLEEIEFFMPRNIVLDIALQGLKNEKTVLKLLEINSVNTSGLYACDPLKIVEAYAI